MLSEVFSSDRRVDYFFECELPYVVNEHTTNIFFNLFEKLLSLNKPCTF